MKILLIDIDSIIPNIALKKIELFYDGHEIIWDYPLAKGIADKIYVSCVFKKNKWKCYEWEGIAEIGGSGYDLKKTLPPEIDCMKPKLNLGFTTRGCIRNCYFCIVPEKEGYIHSVGDIYDFWDGESKELTILDNNILAMPEHFKMICGQLRKEKLKVDFNQGLDHRLLTDDLCEELLPLKHIREIRFAYDDIAYEKTVLRALDMLKRHGIKDWGTRWYVYIGEKDDFYSVYKRMLLLREYKQAVYVMRDEKVYARKEYIALARWGNTIGAFKMGDLREVIKKADGFGPYMKSLKQYKF